MTHTEELAATLKDYGRKSFLTDAQWELVYELWCLGYSPRELGEWLQVHPNTIRYHFRRLGFTPDKRLPLSSYNEKLRKLGDTHARPQFN